MLVFYHAKGLKFEPNLKIYSASGFMLHSTLNQFSRMAALLRLFFIYEILSNLNLILNKIIIRIYLNKFHIDLHTFLWHNILFTLTKENVTKLKPIPKRFINLIFRLCFMSYVPIYMITEYYTLRIELEYENVFLIPKMMPFHIIH